MGAIDSFLRQIRQAIYGREVRESIAKGIEQCYSDATDVVKVSDTPPTGENVKLWVKPESDEYQVPTWEEFQALECNVNPVMIHGRLDGQGNVLPDDDRWITQDFIPTEYLTSLVKDASLTIYIDYYTYDLSTDTYVFQSYTNTSGSAKTPINRDSGTHIKLYSISASHGKEFQLLANISRVQESETRIKALESEQRVAKTGIINVGTGFSDGVADFKFSYEQGAISSLGVDYDSAKYIRSYPCLINDMLMIVKVASGYDGYVDYYAPDGTFSYVKIPASGFLFIDRTKESYRLSVKKTNGDDVTVENDSDAITVTVYGRISFDIPELVEYPGYYGGTGGTIVQPATSYAEKYTNWIYVGDASKLYWRLNYPTSHTSAIWIAYVIKYKDLSMERIVPPVPSTAQGFSYEIVIPENAEYVSFTYRSYGETVSNDIYIVLDQVKKRVNYQDFIQNQVETERNKFRTAISVNPYRLQPFHDHLFIDANGLGTDKIIPSESLAHIRMSRRMGFTVIEGNVHLTATAGGYVVMHGTQGKFGREVVHVDGVTDVSELRFTAQTLDWIKENLVYDSNEAKYRTSIPTLEEWLYECKANNLIPLVSLPDDASYDIVNGIMGESNYIAYNGKREKTSAMIVDYVGLTTKQEILEHARSIGIPYMYTMSNPDSFTDSELKDIVESMHAEGYLIGIAGCYETEQEWQRDRQLGFDFSASGWRTPDIVNGDLCNLASEPSFEDFVITGGTVDNGVLTLPPGAKVSWTGSSAVYWVNMALHAVFEGTVKVTCGKYLWKSEFTSDGSVDNFYSSYGLNWIPGFTIEAVTNTNISSITFKASKC